MYQEKYSFEDFLDVKTILLVLGTLGGAFMGAYFASKYSIDQTTRQMNHQRDLIQEQNLDQSLKYSITSLTILISCKDFLTTVDKNLEKEIELEKIKMYLKYVKEILEDPVHELNSMNIISVLRYEIYTCVYKGYNAIYFTLDQIDLMLEQLSREDEVNLKSSCSFLQAQVKDSIEKLETNINMVMTLTKQEALNRKEVLTKLNEI
jgi:hypothetical protein